MPGGFATTASAYWDFLDKNKIKEKLHAVLNNLDRNTFNNLMEIGSAARALFTNKDLPSQLIDEISTALSRLQNTYGTDISLAVRSSATAEDLPNASFAGQQETYLNIRNCTELLRACVNCFRSLFTDRAIKYREDHGFDHMKVALSVGVQLMVRSDKGSSGVIFTLDPDSGFRDVVLINGIWGLGENIVQGTIIPDEFYVFKPTLQAKKKAIISRRLGSKLKTMIYSENKATDHPVVNIDTPKNRQETFVLTDLEVETLAHWSVLVENHYGRPMDLEWAKDGITNKLFIVQARPETVFSQKATHSMTTYHLESQGNLLCSGIGLSNRIVSGKARILSDPRDRDKLQAGEILVTSKTNPDWDPILKKAAAIITDQGGRTSHAAIVARELGAVAVVGTSNATQSIVDGQEITVACHSGKRGDVYEGILSYSTKTIDLEGIEMPATEVKLILGDPDQAFHLAQMPNNGIGLMRLEFIINHSIQIHPLALKYFDQIDDPLVLEKIETLTHHYPAKENYFIDRLAEAVATIAAAFYPKEVIVRLSDFKSNEYANLLGGQLFEPKEDNPMIGFRGASRYYDKKYKEGFMMECKALKIVRDEMGLTNVKIMIPFCRTIDEAKKVINILASQGLHRGKNALELYLMIEIPSNVILAEDFAPYFDGFSIGSNDLTQLTLGIDRDSEFLSDLFDPRDPSVLKMIEMVINSAKKTKTKIGLCGQAPSDYPEYAKFLVDLGIDSISFNPDALLQGIINMSKKQEAITSE
ncbi:MAG: phosphoenolpyruvate synthase [Saprospiraceae bacterium]|nr:phosphoenolpyruvate synthase [Saprospiraceae bacterium]